MITLLSTVLMLSLCACSDSPNVPDVTRIHDLSKELNTISYHSSFFFIDKGELCSAYYENQDFGEKTYYVINLDSVMSGE